jgi:hypothetical protein
MRLAIDHDHKTGVVRGLLCKRCNSDVLGAADERSDILLRAAAYLEAPPAITGLSPESLGHAQEAWFESMTADAKRAAQGGPWAVWLYDEGEEPDAMFVILPYEWFAKYMPSDMHLSVRDLDADAPIA